MRFASLFSGGKDSVLSTCMAIEEGHELGCLVSVISKNPESYMYHVPNIKLVKLQAEAMEVPLLLYETEGVKEEELKELLEGLTEAKKKYDISGVVSGAIYSRYQRSRIEATCMELKLKSITPLWKLRPKELSEMVDNGYVLIMSAVAAGGLGPEWLGREITKEVVEELATLHKTCYVCTGGEGGEFETLVLDSPLFKKRLEIVEAEPKWDGQAGVYVVKEARLVGK